MVAAATSENAEKLTYKKHAWHESMFGAKNVPSIGVNFINIGILVFHIWTKIWLNPCIRIGDRKAEKFLLRGKLTKQIT